MFNPPTFNYQGMMGSNNSFTVASQDLCEFEDVVYPVVIKCTNTRCKRVHTVFLNENTLIEALYANIKPDIKCPSCNNLAKVAFAESSPSI